MSNLLIFKEGLGDPFRKNRNAGESIAGIDDIEEPNQDLGSMSSE